MAVEKLYEEGPEAGVQAPILITHFEGAMDAGSAGTLAVVQMLRNFSPQRVATFDADRLIDYRSHRPVMVVEEWVTREVIAPEIALDLVHDDSGTPILILHGPEPDARWESFAENVADLAQKAGVEAVVSFHGIPAAVPHTRPISVHIQSTDEDLVPDQPLMGTTLQFPAPMSTFLHYRLSEKDLHGISLIAAVPYYMADSPFPRAGSALLSKLSQMAELSLPIGDLERGADEDASQVNHLLGQNPEVERTVRALEQHYDSMSDGNQVSPFGPRAVFLGSENEIEPALEGSGSEADEKSDELTPDEFLAALNGDIQQLSDNSENGEANQTSDDSVSEEESVADAIGAAIEQYLRNQMKTKSSSSNDSAASETDKAVNDDRDNDSSLKEVDDSSEGIDSRHLPRHRAPKPWEKEN